MGERPISVMPAGISFPAALQQGLALLGVTLLCITSPIHAGTAFARTTTHPQPTLEPYPDKAATGRMNRRPMDLYMAGLFSPGKGFGTPSGERFLKPDQAFIFSTEILDRNTLTVRWRIAPGYYLYRKKFAFELQDADRVTLGPFHAPRGEIRHDETYGRTEVYYEGVELTIPLHHSNHRPVPVTMKVHFQGCAEDGYCYPPASRDIELWIPALNTIQPGAYHNPRVYPPSAESTPGRHCPAVVT